MIDKKEIIKEIEKEEHKVIKSMRNNPWMLSSIILGVVALILIFNSFSESGLTKNIISADEAGKKLLSYYLLNGAEGLELSSVEEQNELYKVNFKYQGAIVPIYTTKDGQLAGSMTILVAKDPVMGNNIKNSNINANAPQDIPKSDKPIVEAFIFSYCPYGLQFEKALFPVYDLLKDKADFRIVAIGAMHGEYEKIESLRQISIEQLYDKAKLFAYLKEFDANTGIGSCRGDDSCLDKYLPSIYSKLGIDKTKIEEYMKTDASKVYDEQNARANSLGVGGSPTFVINRAQVQVNRNADSIKEAVCDAFNSEPEECSQSLSTQSASPGFG